MPKEGYKLSKGAVQRTAKAVREVLGGVGSPSRRPVPTRRRDRTFSINRPDMAYCQVASYDATNDVITTKDSPLPVALPTGTPSITGAIKVYDREGVGFSADDYFYAIKSVNVHSDGTHGQVDWVVLPTAAAAGAKIVTVSNGHASHDGGEPVTTLTGYWSGAIGEQPIWIELLDDQLHKSSGLTFPSDLFWLPAFAKLIGVPNGTYDPDPEGTSDERPLYSVQHPGWGARTGFVEYEGLTAADYSDVAAPVFGGGKVYLYQRANNGDITISDPITVVNTLPHGIEPGTLVEVVTSPFGLKALPACDELEGYGTWSQEYEQSE